jgi:hypothetical protein
MGIGPPNVKHCVARPERTSTHPAYFWTRAKKTGALSGALSLVSGGRRKVGRHYVSPSLFSDSLRRAPDAPAAQKQHRNQFIVHNRYPLRRLAVSSRDAACTAATRLYSREHLFRRERDRSEVNKNLFALTGEFRQGAFFRDVELVTHHGWHRPA